MKSAKGRKIIKWLLYVLFAALLFCFQAAPVKLGIFDGVLYLLPFAVAISCFEGALASAVTAAICGLFWDYCALRQFGFNAILLCLICVAVSLVMNFYIRPMYLSAVAAIGCAVVIHGAVDFFFFFMLNGYSGLAKLWATHYLPLLVKTIIFGAGICFVVKKIYDLSPAKADFDA